MADFGEDEDIELFQLAKMFVDAHNPIGWDYITKRMKATKKTRIQLRNRLKAMKQRYGCDLSAFPARFHAALVKKTRCRKKASKALVNQRLRSEEVWGKIANMFGSVSKALVQQKGGDSHLNVGEILPKGISDLLAAIGDLHRSDVFLDVGAGVGNVVCHVAMETVAAECVGVELRPDLTSASQALVSRAMADCSLLQKVRLYPGDIRAIDLSKHADFKRTTILYAFNTLFEIDTNLALERATCSLRLLHTFVVAVHPCPRHTVRCMKEFCLLWRLEQDVSVVVSFTCKPVPLHIFRRR